MEIRRMVDEKRGKDRERGQELFAFLGSMYLLRKILHFVLSNSGKFSVGCQSDADLRKRRSYEVLV